MSVAVNRSTELAVEGGPLASTPTAISVVVLALLTLILIQRELFRIREPEAAGDQLRVLDMAAGPLLVAGAGLLALRFLTILGTL